MTNVYWFRATGGYICGCGRSSNLVIPASVWSTIILVWFAIHLNICIQVMLSIDVSKLKVCWRHSQPVNWAIGIVQNLCSVLEHPRERVAFLHTIIDTFREVILDLHEFGDSGNGPLSLIVLVVFIFVSYCNLAPLNWQSSRFVILNTFK